MSEATAWVLPLADNISAAIGEREMIHLVDDAEFFEVPESPFYCRQAIVWQGDVLPVVDIASWLEGKELQYQEGGIVGVVAYQEHAGELPKHGGVRLKNIPVRKQVTNQQACALPEPHNNWQTLAISCFSDNGRATPILNLAEIFAKAG